MLEQILAYLPALPALTSWTNTILMLGIGLGAMLFVYGAFDAFSPGNPAAKRFRRYGGGQRRSSFDNGLLHNPEVDPKGLMKALMPQDRKERSKLKRHLAHAGFHGDTAVVNFYALRFGLALGLPFVFFLLTWAARTPGVWLPGPLDYALTGLPDIFRFQALTLLLGVGFFLPAIYVNARAEDRTREINEAFPNALDLIQISVEAGMGFDSAMTRVANEMVHSAPAISQEFRMVQLEVAAGGSRDKALKDLAERTGVDEVASFANVVLQSMQFGTSIAESLTVYAEEMRLRRELYAQEKANQLPVKMSVVLSALMMPAMIILLVGPVAIRWMNSFGAI